MKVKILNRYIFPAMADLTFFFEAIAEYPELQETFANDLKDLLGIRRYDPDKTEYGYMLQSLIGAILILGNESTIIIFTLITKTVESRFKLLHKLQRLIWYKFSPYISKMFPDNPEVQGNNSQ